MPNQIWRKNRPLNWKIRINNPLNAFERKIKFLFIPNGNISTIIRELAVIRCFKYRHLRSLLCGHRALQPDITTPIETKRLFIRPYTIDDARWYYRMSLKNKEHLVRYESENPIMSIQTEADAMKVIKDFVVLWDEQRYRFIGVFLKETNEFVAQIYLGRTNAELPEFVIGYFADIDQTGKGYVSEAVTAVVRELFAKVRAHRIQIETDDTNTGSIRVAEKCGFVREGHLRQNKKNPDGTISGTLYFGILKSEFHD